MKQAMPSDAEILKLLALSGIDVSYHAECMQIVRSRMKIKNQSIEKAMDFVLKWIRLNQTGLSAALSPRSDQ